MVSAIVVLALLLALVLAHQSATYSKGLLIVLRTLESIVGKLLHVSNPFPAVNHGYKCFVFTVLGAGTVE